MSAGFVERRRYFRLDDQVLLAFVPIESHKAQLLPLTRSDALDRMEIEINNLLGQLRSRDPILARLAELMNQKFNQLYSQTRLDVSSMPEPLLTNVNLSACGIRFETDIDVRNETHLKLYLTLLPSNTPMLLIARIVAVETPPVRADDTNTKPWLIRATFDPIPESDEEQLIQHMLRLQSRQLAARQYEQD